MSKCIHDLSWGGCAQPACQHAGKVIEGLEDEIAAEGMRAMMLNTVHRVALNQNTAMLELADHYTGSLWPEEVQRAAKEIIKAGRDASGKGIVTERPNQEIAVPAPLTVDSVLREIARDTCYCGITVSRGSGKCHPCKAMAALSEKAKSEGGA